MARRPEPSRSSRRDDPRLLEHGVRLLHEDDDVIVIEKPVGLLSSLVDERERERGGPSAFGVVKAHVARGQSRTRRGRDENDRRPPRTAWIVHRLDRDVSGVMLFAKNKPAFETLTEELRARRIARGYLAVVEGSPPSGDHAGSIDAALDEGRDGIVRVVEASATKSSPRSRTRPDEARREHAITHYTPLLRYAKRTLLAVRLETGRKNQIRAHLAHLGMPIVGDLKYGAATNPIHRIALHAATLAFAHPVSGAALRFDCPPPPEVLRLVDLDHVPARATEEHVEPTRRAGAPERGAPSPASSGWNHVAGWYDDLIGERGSDHYEEVILPGALRLLAPRSGMRMLDIACGQGVLARRLATQGVDVVGVDAAERLVQSARESARGDRRQRFEVADARALDRLDLGGAGSFDAAACIMALMNIEPLEPLVREVARLLKPGGAFVAVIIHPAFRSPGQTSWVWVRDPAEETDRTRKQVVRSAASGSAARSPRTKQGSAERQYRRVDAYLTPTRRGIVMNPGAVSSGAGAVETVTHHRPIQNYLRLLAGHGLLLDALEEWSSTRTSQPGPRADEENRARREIPMFMALRARRVTLPLQ